jgi:hypothetical protein
MVFNFFNVLVLRYLRIFANCFYDSPFTKSRSPSAIVKEFPKAASTHIYRFLKADGNLMNNFERKLPTSEAIVSPLIYEVVAYRTFLIAPSVL